MANSLWVGAVRTGLAAAKPTVPDFPSETFGFYYETDTGILNFGSSSAWLEMLAPVSNSASGFTASDPTDVAVSTSPMALQKLTLTLSGVSAGVADADDFGSAALVTLPDTNLIVMGCEVNLELTKDGTGYIAATDLSVALGTAAASNTTLSSTMVNILPAQSLTASDLSPALAAHSLATTPVLTGILDGAANVIYLNVSGSTETSEDAVVTADGTVTIYYVDLGNITS